ncbi:hypothetical protein [Micromonospora parathelypteridis]|uniref:ABC-type glycerol-3-phosphate transport system permease component n=1 Tax=Micromonospora parathelypteridis TaxID=1839617 RepID=A0A840VHW5_9ACTN|nr:hypothetical protein [Micromonospora parathelypteridis]MBB5476347.1 ABC-type glycerol-3-phosphate transport system permease component [Micromonospora parathelypteridis]
MSPVLLAVVLLLFVIRNAGLLGIWTGLILLCVASSPPFTVFFVTALLGTRSTSMAMPPAQLPADAGRWCVQN